MKQIARHTRRRLSSAPVLLMPLLLPVAGCNVSDAQNTKATTPVAESPRATVSDGGARITLDADAMKRFTTIAAAPRDFAVAQRLPGRVVATAVASPDLGTPLLLFETPDLSQNYAEYQRARTELARTRRVAERLRALATNGAAAGKDLDDAEVDALQADSHVRETEARLREAGLDPVVLSRLRPGTALITADLPEARVGLVHAGAKAAVDLTSFPDATQQGDVIAVSDAIDPQSRTARVAVLVTQRAGVRPGMFASVQVTQRATNAVAIPRTALVLADARTFAFVRTAPTVFERREVALGPDDGSLVAVLRGITAGEQVVTGNVILLKGYAFGY